MKLRLTPYLKTDNFQFSTKISEDCEIECASSYCTSASREPPWRVRHVIHFKRLKIFSATRKRVTQRGAEHKGPGPRWGTGEHRGGRRLVVDEHLLTTNVRRRRRLVVGEHLSTTNVRRWRDEML